MLYCKTVSLEGELVDNAVCSIPRADIRASDALPFEEVKTARAGSLTIDSVQDADQEAECSHESE